MASPRPARLAPGRIVAGLGLSLLGAGLVGHGSWLGATIVLLAAAALLLPWPRPVAVAAPTAAGPRGAAPRLDGPDGRAALHELNNALLAASATAELVAGDLGNGAQSARARRLVDAIARARAAAARLSGAEPQPASPRPASGAAAGTAPVRPLRVLIADDDPAVRRVLALGLERLGHAVETVGDGDSALERARSGGLDAVVLDLNMPGRDGLEVAAALLGADPPWPGRVLLASGERVDATLRARAGELGCELFPKPYSPSDLARALGANSGPQDH